MKVRRCLIVAALGVLLLPAAASSAASSAKVDPAAAASVCAGARALRARLGGHDVAYLTRFVPCIVRTERRQLGLGYRQSLAASRLAEQALAHLITLPYVTTPQRDQAEIRAARNVAVRMCEHRGFHRATFQVSFGDTAPPPVLTPMLISRLIGLLFSYPLPVARSPRAAWGVAVRHGLMFERGNRNGASVLLVDFACS